MMYTAVCIYKRCRESTLKKLNSFLNEKETSCEFLVFELNHKVALF